MTKDHWRSLSKRFVHSKIKIEEEGKVLLPA